MFLRNLICISFATYCLSMEAQPLKMPEMVAASTPNNYIIKIKGDSSKIASYLAKAATKVSAFTVASIASAQKVKPSQLKYGMRRKHKSINGFSVTLSEEDVADLKTKFGAEIAYIESDLKVYPTGYDPVVPWGLARISYRAPAAEMTFKKPKGTGKGVTVYIIDSGIKVDHPSFGGRASMGPSFLKTEPGTQDGTGHGTHVAGIVASAKYGIAPEAKVVGLKVFDSKGGSDSTAVIAALDHVTKNAVPGKTVVNLSLVTGKTQAINDAANAAAAKGVVVVVAAGNNGADSCTLSPASATDVLSVGASDNKDRAADFSSWGKCVDIYAPGIDIPSLGIKANDEMILKTGTSMASPYVAGVAALYLSQKSYENSKAAIKDVLKWAYRCVKGTKGGSGTGIVYSDPSLQ